jgi:hypothetical protein
MDITAESGLSEKPVDWPQGGFQIPEVMGGGVAFLDYDNDDDLDILEIRFPSPDRPNEPAPNRLYRREPDGRYVDVSDGSGIADGGYGQGVAAGDVDNDGDVDVFVANYGLDALYFNNGDGTFSKAPDSSGITGDHWSVAAAFVDYDRDNDLDLFVVHYLLFDPNEKCVGKNGSLDFCNPQIFPNTPDTLYQNNGDGTFSDVTENVGITTPGRGLGVICVDFTGDDWVDMYVANDMEANHLWVNQGDGTFVDEAVMKGAAFNDEGFGAGSMGVAAGDVDGNGGYDLFMTHLTRETNTLYCSTAVGVFRDCSSASGMAPIDLPFTGFGCGMFDFDHDGDLDVAVVNGRIKRGPILEPAFSSRFWSHYAEPNLLFKNDGSGRFSNASEHAGSFAWRVEVTRGLAFGDIDDDGDIDMLSAGVAAPIRLFRNQSPKNGDHWLKVRAITGKRDALGADVTVIAGSSRFRRPILAASSYIASSEPRAHFGLGGIDRIDAIETVWPDGNRERFETTAVDRLVIVRQGDGTPQ